MSSFREISESSTFAIPGYPGYYYRPMDESIVSNKTHAKYTVGTVLKTYTTTSGEKYVYALDFENCRRRLTIDRVKELLSSEMNRTAKVHTVINQNDSDMNKIIMEQRRIEEYIRLKEQKSFSGVYFTPAPSTISIDMYGNIILPPAIVFFQE